MLGLVKKCIYFVCVEVSATAKEILIRKTIKLRTNRCVSMNEKVFFGRNKLFTFFMHTCPLGSAFAGFLLPTVPNLEAVAMSYREHRQSGRYAARIPKILPHKILILSEMH